MQDSIKVADLFLHALHLRRTMAFIGEYFYQLLGTSIAGKNKLFMLEKLVKIIISMHPNYAFSLEVEKIFIFFKYCSSFIPFNVLSIS